MKTEFFENFEFFWDFYIDPGGPGGHPGVSRTVPGGEKHQKKIFPKIDFFHFGPFPQTQKNTLIPNPATIYFYLKIPF